MPEPQKKQSLVESFSGVRGVYGQDLNERLAYRYALTYCQLFKNRDSVLVVGGDTRASTPVIKETMIKAFSDFGVNKVIDVGVVPIQACEHAILRFQASGGVYITASHNEGEYNGWKFLKEDGAILYKEQAEKLIAKVRSANSARGGLFGQKPKILKGNKKAIDGYISHVLKIIGRRGVESIKKANFKILVDPNGGSAIAILESIFKKLGVKAKIINDRMGKFERLIEPNSESLSYLSEMVSKKDFGFACGFDCDADRVEFVLSSKSNFAKETNHMVSGQYVLALACDVFLAGTKNQTVVVNDSTSYLVREVIKKYGAKIKEVEVGETNVVEEMEKQRSIIGGEGSSSGVIIPPVKCRDGIMAMLLILKIIIERKMSLGAILENYPKYYSRRIKKECDPSKLLKVKKGIEDYFQKKGYIIKKTGDNTGGLKILFTSNSYLWFRQSKTEPGAFRIISDGDDYQLVNKMLEDGAMIFDKLNN